MRERKQSLGNSLVVQRLGLHIFTPGAQVRSLVRELRSCKLLGAAPKRGVGVGGEEILEIYCHELCLRGKIYYLGSQSLFSAP